MLQSKVQEFKTEEDPLEKAMRAVDDICTGLEGKQIPADILTDAQEVCAQLRAGFKPKPTLKITVCCN
jgi:hypothetical protein